MNGMHRTQSDHAHLDLSWSRLFWPSITWDLKALEQKRFDLWSLSPALRKRRLLNSSPANQCPTSFFNEVCFRTKQSCFHSKKYLRTPLNYDKNAEEKRNWEDSSTLGLEASLRDISRFFKLALSGNQELRALAQWNLSYLVEQTKISQLLKSKSKTLWANDRC